jgi:hypothetical protein
MKLIFMAFLAMSFTMAQGQVTVGDSPKIYIADPERADPEKDCGHAIRSGDLRFVGVAGFALSVPGVDDYHPRFWKTNGVKVIAGTGDVGNRRFNEQAITYAARYNATLLKYLSTKRVPKP